MILLKVPSVVKTFVQAACRPRGSLVRRMLGVLLVGFILVRGRRTLANLAGAVAEGSRHKSNVCRFLHSRADDLVACYDRAFRRAVRRLARCSRRRGTRRWVFAIDTTFQRKHAIRMPSLIKFREKSKGVPARNHAFLVGVLLGPDGVRIPFPVLPYMTREFLDKVNSERKQRGEAPLPYRTQLDLAVQLLYMAKEVVPKGIELMVVADNFFEGPKLDRACNELGFTYVTPLDGGRVLAAEAGKGKKVRDIEGTLPGSDFRRVVFEEGREPFADHRRRETTRRKPGRRKQTVYHVAQRALPLSGLGERTVFFSWKGRRPKNRTARAKAHFKTLVTNNPHLSAEEAVDAYLLRWSIELFFREQKSEIGLGHYQVLTLDAIHAHVHLAFLAHLLLEEYRLTLLDTREPAWLAAHRIRQARTRQIAAVLEAEARREEVDMLQSAARRAPGKLLRWLRERIRPRKIA